MYVHAMVYVAFWVVCIAISSARAGKPARATSTARVTRQRCLSNTTTWLIKWMSRHQPRETTTGKVRQWYKRIHLDLRRLKQKQATRQDCIITTMNLMSQGCICILREAGTTTAALWHCWVGKSGAKIWSENEWGRPAKGANMKIGLYVRYMNQNKLNLKDLCWIKLRNPWLSIAFIAFSC